MQDWKKYIEGVADKRIDHNVNINVVNEQARVLKEAVLSVLQEIDPSLVTVFVTRLDNKLNMLDANNRALIEGEVIDVY